VTKRSSLPPHRRHGDPSDPVAAYVALVDSLASARKSGNVAWEVLVLDALDRAWWKLSSEQKRGAKERLRAAYGDRWE
jgi:hypothetical protein